LMKGDFQTYSRFLWFSFLYVFDVHGSSEFMVFLVMLTMLSSMVIELSSLKF